MINEEIEEMKEELKLHCNLLGKDISKSAGSHNEITDLLNGTDAEDCNDNSSEEDAYLAN